MTREHGKVLRHSAFLYSSVHVFAVLKFVAGFLVAGILGPTLYGLRSVFGMVVEYEQFSHAGTFDAMRKEVPYHRGREDRGTADAVLGTVLLSNLGYALVASAGLAIAAGIVWRSDVDPIYAWFLGYLALHIPLTRCGDFLVARLVVDKRTASLARLKLLYGTVNAVASVGFVYGWGLPGLFVGLLIGSAVRTGWLIREVGSVPRIDFSWSLLGRLFRVGAPIMSIGLMFLLLRSVDRVLIVSMLSPEMLGYFAVATIVSGFIYHSLAEVIGVVFLPRVMERLGRTGDRQQIKEYLIDPMVLVAYFVPLLVGAVYLAIHVPLLHLAPRYAPAIAVCQILTLAAFFFCVATMPVLVCVAVNRQVQVVGLTFLAVLLNGALNVALIQGGFGIEGVAAGTAVSYMVFSTVMIGYAMAQFGARPAETGRLLVTVFVPFAWAVVLLLALDAVAGSAEKGFWQDVGLTALRCLAFAVGFLPVFVLARRHPALGRLRRLVPSAPRRGRATAPRGTIS